MRQLLLLALCLFLTIPVLEAQEMSNEEVIQVIRKYGLDQSQVIETASWMTDVYGPRLTGSPMLDMATEWATNQLEEWGMSNVHLHEWGPFGRGWELDHFEMHAHSPGYWPVLGYPKAWSPGTDGEVTGELIYLQASKLEDLEQYKGKLAGKIVMLDTIRDTDEWFDPMARRYESDDLLRLANAPAPTPRPRRNYARTGGLTFNQAMWKMLTEEEPLVILDRSYKGDLGTVFVSRARTHGGSYREAGTKVIPQVTLSVEHYNRIMRLMQKGVDVKLTLNLKSKYTNPDGMEHNIIAEIPGSDLSDEVVLFGAHFDSWHAATGATDNAAGSSVMMEVARILLETIKETGIQPRRTLRLALWTGEEQGLFGSRHYVGDQYVNYAPDSWTPKSLRKDQEKISGYFNMDNGTGKIRGVYLQGNDRVAPLFREWLQPFKDLEAGTLTLNNTGGTDHLAFDAANVPGFQFIQDPMAYFNRTHHSNMDNWDHLVEDDLKQAATIIAAFVWNTAQLDEKLPRKKTDLTMEPGAAESVISDERRD